MKEGKTTYNNRDYEINQKILGKLNIFLNKSLDANSTHNLERNTITHNDSNQTLKELKDFEIKL